MAQERHLSGVCCANCFVLCFSGYGSQAVSCTNLSSEDSVSLRSISVDETPDMESRPLLVVELQPVSEAVTADATADILTKQTQDIDINVATETRPSAVEDTANENRATPDDEKSTQLDIRDEDNSSNDSSHLQTLAAESDPESDRQSSAALPDRHSLSLPLTNNSSDMLSEVPETMQVDVDMRDVETVVESLSTKSDRAEERSDEESGAVNDPSRPESADESSAMHVAENEDALLEGSSVVHTKLPPGKVCSLFVY